MALTIDLAGHRAKSQPIGASDSESPFVPAQISPDTVSWQSQDQYQFYAFRLDRGTGGLRESIRNPAMRRQEIDTYTCKIASKVF
jgi:hypothetical protein